MHYAQEHERPNTQSIRDGEEGKGNERLPVINVSTLSVSSAIFRTT